MIIWFTQSLHDFNMIVHILEHDLHDHELLYIKPSFWQSTNTQNMFISQTQNQAIKYVSLELDEPIAYGQPVPGCTSHCGSEGGLHFVHGLRGLSK